MATEQFVIFDVNENRYQNDFSVSQESGIELSGSAAWSVSKHTLRGGLSAGVDVVEINNGALALSLLPTRGMGIWRGEYRGISLGWDSPVQRPVNPSFVNLHERSGLGWLNGFQEFLCRCGLASNGPPGTDVVLDNNGNEIQTDLTLHGKIANTPAWRTEVEISDVDSGLLSVTGYIDESMMFGPSLRLKSTLQTAAGSSSFTIIDEVTNLGGQTTELQLLYHTNIGQPLLDEGTRFVAPIRELAPRDSRAQEGIDSFPAYSAPVTGFVEQVYFMTLLEDATGRSVVLLKNSTADKGLSLEFQPQQLPYFSLWKNTQSMRDGYVTGLEPATNFPNLKTFERERGRVVTLEPSESAAFEITITVLDSIKSVADVENRIAKIQSQVAPTVHSQPIARFTPVS